MIKENIRLRPKFQVATIKQCRPLVLSHDLLEGSRQLNDVATKKRSRHQIEATTPILGNKKNEVATRILTVDN